MAKYLATKIEPDDRYNEKYLVAKRRLFGLLDTQYRVAVWDGITTGSSRGPGWYWEAADGTRSEVRVRFRAKWALMREYKRVRCLTPTPWSSAPTARMLVAG